MPAAGKRCPAGARRRAARSSPEGSGTGMQSGSRSGSLYEACRRGRDTGASQGGTHAGWNTGIRDGILRADPEKAGGTAEGVPSGGRNMDSGFKSPVVSPSGLLFDSRIGIFAEFLWNSIGFRSESRRNFMLILQEKPGTKDCPGFAILCVSTEQRPILRQRGFPVRNRRFSADTITGGRRRRELCR